ncbi:SpoIIE family protein phosphatase [Streptomyces odontomachi]|uniref:SpoIIE family protein phosphatase n=1 Tax=Streptomyces odontomachi TaxID=2944940 RepID=UPI00210DA6F1|nr:SpoIIE family protein phosphatase [Streptomyces sp. ODS25]
MPVPVPRQRNVPAAESGQAHTPPVPGVPESTAGPVAAGALASSGASTATDAPTADPLTTPADASPADASHGAASDTGVVPRTGSDRPDGHPTHDADAGSHHDADHHDGDDGCDDIDGPADRPGRAGASGSTNLTLLVIEDDPARSLNVPELLDASGNPIKVRTARNLTEAERLLTDDVHCILLDLALRPAGRRGATQARDRDTAPAGAVRGTARDRTVTGPHEAVDSADLTKHAEELTILEDVLRLAPRHAVLALTGSSDLERGAEAVRVGAQDYLVREELDGRLLSRAIRYAVERKRADAAQRQLTESRMRAQENARLERGLLPTPLLDGSALQFAARYRPGRSRALLGGDFYDTVRTPDGTVHAMIGDVCGHGPDEAALGVELRIAWRALTLAGLSGDALLSTLQQVLEHERADDEIFATLCTVDIAPDGRHAGFCLAGHPAPLLAPHDGPAELLPYEENGPALGMLPHARWPRQEVELGPSWSLMLYTDGLIEGRVGQGTQRLGQEGMVDMVRRKIALGLSGDALLGAALNEARDLNGGDLTDDVAVLLLAR